MTSIRRHALYAIPLSCTAAFGLFGGNACTTTTSIADASPDSNVGSPLGFTPSNVDPSKLDFTGVGDVVISSDLTIETDLGGVLGVAATYKYVEISQTSGPALGVFVVKSLTISSGTKVRVEGKDALVIVALETITIDGSLSGNSQENPAFIGPGVTDQPDLANIVGLGNGGGGAGSKSTSGAGAGYCGVGGAGSSLSGAADAAKGGLMWGTAAIVPLVVGSNGGNGGVGSGGNGGGALQLVAGKSISVSGVIHVGGKGGWNSGVFDPSGTLSQQGSGGGSGGSILIEAPTVDLHGTLAANGGGGGGNTLGSDATPDIQAANGGTGAATHAAGGAGSSASGLNGEDGTSTPNATSGGGGGAAGRIRVNTASGQATLGGTISPSASTTCTTQGKLSP